MQRGRHRGEMQNYPDVICRHRGRRFQTQIKMRTVSGSCERASGSFIHSKYRRQIPR